MAGSILDWPKHVKTIHGNLSPGGWAEFQDYNGRWSSDDGSLREDSHVYRWIDGLITAGENLGRDPMPGPKLEGWVKDTGAQKCCSPEVQVPNQTVAKRPPSKDGRAVEHHSCA